MAEQTPNYNLTKPDLEEFYDVEVQNNNMDIIDVALKDSEQQLIEHLAEKTITTKTAARTISVTGAQQIVFRQGLKGVNILAVIDGTNVTSNGYAALDGNNTTQHCVSTTPDGYRLISTTSAIVIRQSSVDTAVAIASISDDTLTLNWTKFNGNPDATVNLLITAFYH